jgi:hypothetical protein
MLKVFLAFSDKHLVAIQISLFLLGKLTSNMSNNVWVYYTPDQIVWSPRIALTAVILISFYMEPSGIHNTQIPGG